MLRKIVFKHKDTTNENKSILYFAYATKPDFAFLLLYFSIFPL